MDMFRRSHKVDPDDVELEAQRQDEPRPGARGQGLVVLSKTNTSDPNSVSGSIWSVSADRKSGYCVAGTTNNQVHLFRTRELEKPLGIFAEPQATVYSVAIEGDLIAAGAGEIYVWSLPRALKEAERRVRNQSIMTAGATQSTDAMTPRRTHSTRRDKKHGVVIQNALLRRLSGHGGDVNTMQFVGEFLLSGSSDDTIKVWDLQRVLQAGDDEQSSSGESLCVRTIAHHHGTVWDLFATDDGVVYSGSTDQKIMQVNWRTGDLADTIDAHSSWVQAVGANKEFVVSGDEQKSVRVWRKSDNSMVADIEIEEVDGRSCGDVWQTAGSSACFYVGASDGILRAYSYSGDLLLEFNASDSATSIRGICDVGDGTVLVSADEVFLLSFGVGAHACAFSPDGEQILAGGHGGNLNLRNTETQAIVQSFKHCQKLVSACAFFPKGDLVAVCHGRKLTFESVESGETVQEFEHTDLLWACAVSPNGKQVAAGGDDGLIIIRDVATGNKTQEFQGIGSVLTCAFSADGSLFAYGGNNNKVKVCDISEGNNGREVFSNKRKGHVACCAFSADGQFLAVGAYDGTLTIRLVKKLKDKAHKFHTEGAVTAVAFSPDSTLLASGGYDSRVTLRCLQTGDKVAVFKRDDVVKACAFSPDGRWLAVAGSGDFEVSMHRVPLTERRVFEADFNLAPVFSADGTILAWPSSHGLQLKTTNNLDLEDQGVQMSSVFGKGCSVALGQGGGDLTSCAISQKYVAAVKSNKLSIYSIQTGELLHEFEDSQLVNGTAVAISPGHSIVAVGTATQGGGGVTWVMPDNFLTWRSATEGTIAHSIKLDGAAYTVAFSPSGALVACGGSDNALSIYAVDTGAVVRKLKHGNHVKTCAFSPDGKLVATGSGDELRVFVVETGEVAFVWQPSFVTSGSDQAKVAACYLGRETIYAVDKGQLSSTTWPPPASLIVDQPAENVLVLFRLFPGLAMRSDDFAELVQCSLVRAGRLDILRKIKEGLRPLQRGGDGVCALDIAISAHDRPMTEFLVDISLSRGVHHLAGGFDGKFKCEMGMDMDSAYAPTTFQMLLQTFPRLGSKVMDSALIDVTPESGLRLPLEGRKILFGRTCQPAKKLWDAARPQDAKQRVLEVPVEVKTVMVPNFLRDFQTVFECEDLEIFNSECWKVLVESYWELVRPRFLHRFYLYLLYVLLASATVIAVHVVWITARIGELDGPDFEHPGPAFFKRTPVIVAAILHGLLGVVTLVYMFSEGRDLLRHNLVSHFQSGWNILDALVIFGNLLSTVVFFAAPRAAPSFLGVAVLLTWGNLLSFLLAFPNLALFVQMIIIVMRDMKYFMIVLMITFLAFLFGFLALVPESSSLAGLESTVTLFGMILGDFDRDSFGSALAIVFFAAFMFFVVVVMLNLLIAVISDSYEKVRDTFEATPALAQTIVEVARQLSDKEREAAFAAFPERLHVVQPAAGARPDLLWDGGLKSIKRFITDGLKEQRGETDAKFAALVEQVRIQNEQLAGLRHLLEERNKSDPDAQDSKDEDKDDRDG